MKLPFPIHPVSKPDQQGSAVVIVFVLLTLLVFLLVSNHQTVKALRLELQLLEQKHQSQRTPVARPEPVSTDEFPATPH